MSDSNRMLVSLYSPIWNTLMWRYGMVELHRFTNTLFAFRA
ncbi:hypothetical protein ACRN9C_06285 [Shewanella frigidimarina]